MLKILLLAIIAMMPTVILAEDLWHADWTAAVARRGEDSREIEVIIILFIR